MTSNMKDFKKKIDEIHVPVEKLDQIISKAVQNEKPNERNRWKKRLTIATSAAVVAFGLLIGSAAVSPAMADIVSKIPIIGSVFSASDDPGLIQVSELGLTQKVNQSKTVKGDTLTIDEVFFDGTRFSLSYALESKQSIEGSYFTRENSFIDIKINGKSVDFGASLGETEITSNLLTGVFEIGSISDLADDFDFQIIFKGNDHKKWKFNIPVNAQKGVEIIEVNHQQTNGGIALNIPHMKLSPVGLNFNYETITNGDGYFPAFMDFKVVDDAGHVIKGHFGGSNSKVVKGTDYTSASFLMDPISENVKELTITPYLNYPDDGGGVEIDSNGNEKEIAFKQQEGKTVEFESFTVKIPENR